MLKIDSDWPTVWSRDNIIYHRMLKCKYGFIYITGSIVNKWVRFEFFDGEKYHSITIREQCQPRAAVTRARVWLLENDLIPEEDGK